MKIIIDAYLDNNLGDDLMIKLLLKRFPQYQFISYTDSAVIRNTFSAFDNLTIKNSTQKNTDYKNTDLYLTIGGSRFQLASLKQRLWRVYRLRRLRRLKRNGSKIVTLGANFGPYSEKMGVKLTEWEVRKNDLITVRDQEAANFLHNFKRINNYHLADDIVYNLDALYERKKPERNGLGISAFRPYRQLQFSYPTYEAMAMLADRYIRETGKQVKLFAFDTEDQNDLSAALHIYNLAEEKSNYEIIPYLGDEQYFLEQYEACERVIAIRFHAAVLADIFEIPFLPVVYSNKMQNFLDDRAYEGASIKLKNLNCDLEFDVLSELIINGESLFSDFKGVHHNASIHFDELEKLLSDIKQK